MPAYNFKEQFAYAVEYARKNQTVRKKRKRRTKVGETLYLFTGMRTPHCRRLRRAICLDVKDTEIHSAAIKLADRFMTIGSSEADRFARADGFSNSAEMIGWFRKTHGLPFNDGVTIYW